MNSEILAKLDEIIYFIDNSYSINRLKVLESKGINILRYNTSKLTPIQIAKSVLNYIEEYDNERKRIK